MSAERDFINAAIALARQHADHEQLLVDVAIREAEANKLMNGDGRIMCPTCGRRCCSAEINDRDHRPGQYLVCAGGCAHGVVHYLSQFRGVEY